MIGAPVDKRLSLAFLLVLAAASLYLTFIIARPFLTPILTASLLAVAIYPLFTRMLRHVRHRGAAAVLTTLLVFLIILVPAVAIVNKLAHETRDLYAWLNEQQQSTGGGWTQYV